MLGQGGNPIKVEDGIFISPSFSMGNTIANKKDSDFDFGNDEYLSAGGFCDTIEQVKTKFKQWFEDPLLNFCVAFTKVSKSTQPEDGGWRWSKWGPYIGEKNPQFEYIYDEDDDIQEVFCYQIYHLLD